MTVDPATRAVYEAHAAAWAAAREGKDRSAAVRLVGRLTPAGADGVRGPVLDLGCGPGILTAALPSGSIGLDPVVDMLGLLRERVPSARAVQGEASALPLRTASVAGALVTSVYVHLARPDLPLALAELHRVLRVDAPAELELFGGDRDLTEVTEGDFAGRRYALWPMDRLRDVAIGAGFAVDHADEHPGDHWPLLTLGLRRSRTLPDIVGPGMRLLVCGLNPSVYAADVGVGFGRPGNRFWPAALEAGLVSVDRDPRHALVHHGIGMTDLVKRATPRADALHADEYRAGVTRVERLCRWLRPAAVCMVGLAGWRAAVDRRATAGWQPGDLGGVPVYVMPSTSGLNAHARLPDLVAHLRAATGPVG